MASISAAVCDDAEAPNTVSSCDLSPGPSDLTIMGIHFQRRWRVQTFISEGGGTQVVLR